VKESTCIARGATRAGTRTWGAVSPAAHPQIMLQAVRGLRSVVERGWEWWALVRGPDGFLLDTMTAQVSTVGGWLQAAGERSKVGLGTQERSPSWCVACALTPGPVDTALTGYTFLYPSKPFPPQRKSALVPSGCVWISDAAEGGPPKFGLFSSALTRSTHQVLTRFQQSTAMACRSCCGLRHRSRLAPDLFVDFSYSLQHPHILLFSSSLLRRLSS